MLSGNQIYMINYKKELIINILGVVIVIALAIYYGFQYQHPLPQKNTLNVKSNFLQTPITLSLAEIRKHNSVNDCWVIVSGKVYDVTSFINLHQGGASNISSFCGQDMTQPFLN